MIVAVGSDKGAPGATTLAAVLGLVWPAARVVVELDPRGADLPYRLMQPGGQPMGTAPSIAGLAVASRPGAAPVGLDHYAQRTAVGVPVIPGECSSRANGHLVAHLPAVAAAAAGWPGVVIADLGGLHRSNPAMVVGRAAEAVLLVIRPTLEGLGHLRDRVEELSDLVGDPRRDRLPVGVVVVTAPGDARAGSGRAGKLLASIGSPVPVIGVFTHDPAGAGALWSGPPTKKLARSALVRSGRDLAAAICRRWPTLASDFRPAGDHPPAGEPPPARRLFAAAATNTRSRERDGHG